MMQPDASQHSRRFHVTGQRHQTVVAIALSLLITPSSKRRLKSAMKYRRITATMTRQQVLDLYFMEARAKLIDIAAFLDRVDCAQGEADFRLKAFRKALEE